MSLLLAGFAGRSPRALGGRGLGAGPGLLLPPDEVARVLADRQVADDRVDLLEAPLQLLRDISAALVGEEDIDAFVLPLDGVGETPLAPDVLLDQPPLFLGDDLGQLLDEIGRLIFGEMG